MPHLVPKLLLLMALLPYCLAAQHKRFPLPAALREVSGLYRQSADSLWWHNDSGDQPRLVLTNAKGDLLKEIILPIKNVDWEDITADKLGNIYIGDFGNNANARKNLRIYVYQPALGLLDSILFQYPDQQAFPPQPEQSNFDMEGFFWYGDTLHLFSKNRLLVGNYITKHYTLPARPGVYNATLTDSIYLKKRVVTAAAISADGKTVALLSYFFRRTLGFIPKTRTTIWILEDFQNSHFLRGNLKKQNVRKFPPLPTQFEAIDFIDNQSVYIASERTPLYRQKAKRIRLKYRKSMPKPS